MDDDSRVHEDCENPADMILQGVLQEASNVDEDINRDNDISEEEFNDEEELQEISPTFTETNIYMQRLQQYARNFYKCYLTWIAN